MMDIVVHFSNPSPWRQRQEDRKFEVSLNYTEHVSKRPNNNNKIKKDNKQTTGWRGDGSVVRVLVVSVEDLGSVPSSHITFHKPL